MRFVNYKILIGAILIVFLLIILKNTTQELIEVRKSGSVLEQLENELTLKQNKNKFLEEQLKHVQTEDFIEEESRERFGLVKEGEVIVQESINSKIEQRISEKLSKPNWKQWVELFF